MAQGMFNTKHMITKQSKPSITERQRAITLNPSSLKTDNELTLKYKHRSASFSNAIHQVVNFVQRKLSRMNDEDKQEFVDLENS